MLKKVALLAISVALALLAAEGLLRLFGYGAVGQGSPWFAGGASSERVAGSARWSSPSCQRST